MTFRMRHGTAALRLWNHRQCLSWVLAHADLFSWCCVTCRCPCHVCALQGGAIRVFDSPLSHKGMFPVSPLFHWVKNVLNFHLDFHINLVSRWEKKGHPYLGCSLPVPWYRHWKRGICSLVSLNSFHCSRLFSIWQVRGASMHVSHSSFLQLQISHGVIWLRFGSDRGEAPLGFSKG